MASTIDQLKDTIQNLTNDIQAMKVCLENVTAVAFSTCNDNHEDAYHDDYDSDVDDYNFDDVFTGDFDYDDHGNGYDDYDSDVDDYDFDDYDFDDDFDYSFDDYYDNESDNDDDDYYEDFPFLELDSQSENNLAHALHHMPTGH